MSTKETNTPIDATDVANYLRQHNDFFVGRDELLADIRIPHSRGQAVSLVEKQMDVLRERNSELRNRLADLVSNARDNDKLFNNTRRLVLSLLDCKTLNDTIDTIYSKFTTDFHIEHTQILLFGHTQTISRAHNVTLESAQMTLGKYLKARQTIGGGLSPEEIQFLFKNKAEHIGSAALAVLSYGDVYGVLAIGNKDPNYYSSSMGTIFLGYIAEVLSRSLRDFSQAT